MINEQLVRVSDTWHRCNYAMKLFLVINIATAFLFYVDKVQGLRRGWRIAEQLLWSASLCGGWPAGWMVMFAAKHKTKKNSFLVAMAIATCVNIWLYFKIWP